MSNVNANLLHLLILRWVALCNVIFVYVLGLKAGPFFIFVLVVLYGLILTIYWHKLAILVRRYPWLTLVDLTIAAALVWLTGGIWTSPYFSYALVSLIIAVFYLGLNKGLLAAAYLSIIYTGGWLVNKQTLATIIKFQDFDLIAIDYIAFFMIAIFFGYPAHVIRQIEKTKEETTHAEAQLKRTMELNSFVSTPDDLSDRELEVLSSLSKGKTNSQIAVELHISEQTVKNHLYRIYKKLGISAREEAILLFHSNLNSMNK